MKGTSSGTTSKLQLDDGEAVELVSKSIGHAIEIRKSLGERRGDRAMEEKEDESSFDVIPDR